MSTPMAAAPETCGRAAGGRCAGAPRRRTPAAWLLALLALSGAAVWGRPAACAELQPFTTSYAWYWHGTLIALSQLALEHRAGDTWVYSSTAKPRGIGRLYPMRPSLQSVMRVTSQTVLPLSFKASGSGRKHDADVHFDWDSGRATGIYEGTRIDLPIHPGVQDDLSVQIALLLQLLQGKTPDTLLEIDKDMVRDYHYSRDGEQRLDTALGPIDTIVYSSHHPGSPRTTSFWCAPSMGYIPVQVQQKRLDDVEWTMKIRSFERR